MALLVKKQKAELYKFLEEGFVVIKNFGNSKVILKKENLEINFDISKDKIITARYISADYSCEICNPSCSSRNMEV